MGKLGAKTGKSNCSQSHHGSTGKEAAIHHIYRILRGPENTMIEPPAIRGSAAVLDEQVIVRSTKHCARDNATLFPELRTQPFFDSCQRLRDYGRVLGAKPDLAAGTEGESSSFSERPQCIARIV